MSAPFSDRIYLTTPLYYVNAKPHLGHAYATILTDVLARFHRQRGRNTRFLTGTDEHGEKIAASALAGNRSPLDYATEVSELFQRAWIDIGLQPDVFYRTTSVQHYTLVQNALQQLKDREEIYFASYEGKYCVGCERFRTDQEWNTEGLCPDHLTPPVIREESNYFFKMSAYQDKLIDFYQQNPAVIQPVSYLKEVKSFLEQPLEDLCISRPITRLKWGIPLPFDANYVTYVWFDALLSYLGGVDFEGKPLAQNAQFRSADWQNVNHIIGKDILKTHAIYWPTMLMALGLPVFKRLQVSGYWLTNGLKMSKSLGNVVDPLEIKTRFGIEPFRYFLLREMSYGADSSFTWEGFVTRANSELANGIGNLASRTLTLVHKNLGARVPSRELRNDADLALLDSLQTLPDQMAAEFENCRYHVGLAKFAEGVAACDRYINDQKPWALAKDPSQASRLGAVLGTALDALSLFSVVMAPVLPEGAAQLRSALGRPSGDPAPWDTATQFLPEGSALGAIPRLYPRLELPAADKPA